MNWLEKIVPSKIRTSSKKQLPDGLWSKCDACGATIYTAELEANFSVCPKCDHHMRLPARKRLLSLLDAHGVEEIAANLKPVDKLKFKDSKKYKDRISAAQKQTGENDALIAFSGKLLGEEVVMAAFEFDYMGGSMGSVVGEKFVRAVEKAIALNCPFICFSASGGARMQEGLMSLMQMAKTSAALTQLHRKRLPFISVLTHPTMGGVSASLAMLGDLNLAEPNALIGFAGPRVIEQTVRETLPEGFQRSEFLLEKGAVDKIVDRRQLKTFLAQILADLMFIHRGRLVIGTENLAIDKDSVEVMPVDTLTPAEAPPQSEVAQTAELLAPDAELPETLRIQSEENTSETAESREPVPTSATQTGAAKPSNKPA